MRGSRIPSAKRIINSVAPLNPADLSEANANNLMFIWDNMGTGEYMEDASVLARHFANLLPREQTVPNLTLLVEAGSATFATTFVSFAGGNSPTFTAPATNPRIDMLSINSSGTLVRTAGVEAASPVAPSVPVNNIPLCLVYNEVGQTTIRDFDEQVAGQGYILTDLRPFIGIGGGVIKSVQRSVISYTFSGAANQQFDQIANATITSVDTTKCKVTMLGIVVTNSTGALPQDTEARVELTSATNVRAHLSSNFGGTVVTTINIDVGFEVLEYL